MRHSASLIILYTCDRIFFILLGYFVPVPPATEEQEEEEQVRQDKWAQNFGSECKKFANECREKYHPSYVLDEIREHDDYRVRAY